MAIYMWREGWAPGANTLLYLSFDNGDLSNTQGITMTGSGIGYETVGTGKCVKLTNTSGGISGPGNLMSSVGTGDFAVSFWIKPVSTTTSTPNVFSNWREVSPRPGCQMFMAYGAWGNFTDKVVFFMQDYNHPTSVSCAGLVGSWHHFVFTRISGTCYSYIDKNLVVTPWSDSINLSNVNTLSILSRNSSNQNWSQAGTCMDEIIVEKQGWDATAVTIYYNQTKGLYGIN